MNRERPTGIIWTAAIAAACAWPIGKAIGIVLSTGQDGLGAALANEAGSVVTLLVWGASVAIIAWNYGKHVRPLGSTARALVILAIAILPAIALVSAASYQTYTVRVWNQGEAQINDVSVRFSDREYSFSMLVPDKFAASSFQTSRPKGTAVVTWSSDSGQRHEAEFDLSAIVPRRYHNGVLTFSFEENNKVTVGFFIRPRYAYQ